MRKSLVAVAPISMKLVSLAERRRTVRRLVGAAADAGAKLVCFPEFADVQRTLEAVRLPNAPLKRLARRFPEGPFAEAVREAAAEFRIGVLYGQCAFVGRKLLNLTISLDTRGHVLGAYAKTHLAPDEGPEGGLTSGNRIAPLPTVIGSAGVVTCYEVVFPEIARTQHVRGAQFFVVPTAGNSDAFFTMARARAAENHMPLIFSSYSFEKKIKSNGCGAAIVDAYGSVLEKTVYGTKLLSAEIDLDPPHACPVWHGRWPKVNLRAFTWKRRRRALYKM